MNELALMNSLPIERKQYNGQMVVTFRDIDTIHQKPEGTSKRNFSYNKKHFIEGVDYYVVEEGVRNSYTPLYEGQKVFTQTGYLMIVKSFTDDLSWAIQRELVTGYFARQKPPLSFMGTPVIPLKDAAAALGRNAKTVKYHLSSGKLCMGEALLLEGMNLKRYKAENNIRKLNAKAIWIISAQGYEKLKKLLNA